MIFFHFRAASIAASAGGTNSTRPQVKIWPEWTESELAAEKWVRLMARGPNLRGTVVKGISFYNN